MSGFSRRDRRRARPRASVISHKVMAAEVARHAGTPSASHEDRPATRGDCESGPRPCPWVTCRYHLYLDINPRTGSIKLNFPDLEPWEMQNTCALDVAESLDGGSLSIVGEALNLSRERARQLEGRALRKVAPTLAR